MSKIFFKNKTILITGGTGSFGQALVNFLLKNKFPLRKIVILSRDEFKQYEMKKKFSKIKNANIRYLIGDIRDKDRIKLAINDVDILIHAAALKQVPSAEYNPFEYIKTNIIGSQNILEACLDSKISNVLALSTDKASSPINLYGGTKLCSDKLFVSGNFIKGTRNIKFSVVRYGNVMGSRGSVLENFIEQKKSGYLLITDKRMTRFSIGLSQAVDFVINSLIRSKGGEIFIPKIPSFLIYNLAKAVCSSCKIKFIGIRTGEKIHEEMISENESLQTIDLNDCYAIINQNLLKSYKKKFFLQKFSYRSDNNHHFLTIDELRKIVKTFLIKY